MAAKSSRHFRVRSGTLDPMSVHGSFDFAIQAFDSFIRIQCPRADVRDFLDRYIFPPLSRIEIPSNDHVIDVNLVQDSAGYQVVVDGQPAVPAVSLHDAALAAVKALDEAVVRRMKSYRAIHAGAVCIGGQAVLIPGLTHAGKSSLVAELLRRGAKHFSDEYALIDNLGRVHAYPRPLLLRNGRPHQTLVLPEDLKSSFAQQPSPVNYILAVEYRPEATFDVREVSQSQAVMLMLRNTPHEMSQSPAMVDFFLRVASDAHCYEGTRGDATEAASRIFELIANKQTRRP